MVFTTAEASPGAWSSGREAEPRGVSEPKLECMEYALYKKRANLHADSIEPLGFVQAASGPFRCNTAQVRKKSGEGRPG